MIKDAEIQVYKDKLNYQEFIEDDIIMNDDMKKMIPLDEPRRMTFIVVALCTRGMARYTVDTQEQVVTPNKVIIITDRHVLEKCSFSDDLEGVCMMISVKFFYEVVRSVSEISSLFLFAKNHPVVSLSQGEADLFRQYFYIIKRKVADTGNHFRKDVVKTLLLAMVYDLGNIIYQGRQNAGSKNTRADAIFTSFIMLVEDNFKQERRVSWYANQLCITPKYLSESVKLASKRTPTEWIDNYVVLELRIQLRNSAKTIKEIASDLNFPNQSFLGKFFKEHVGMSPSAYRHRALNR